MSEHSEIGEVGLGKHVDVMKGRGVVVPLPNAANPAGFDSPTHDTKGNIVSIDQGDDRPTASGPNLMAVPKGSFRERLAVELRKRFPNFETESGPDDRPRTEGSDRIVGKGF